jgi:Zn-dependent protease with chaperone function
VRADRAFRDLLRAALIGLAALGVPLVVTVFPGALERALHGYDAITDACAAAIYQLGSQLPPLGLLVLGLAGAAAAGGAIRLAHTVLRTSDALRDRAEIPLPARVVDAARRAGVLADARCAADRRPFAYCAGIIRPQVWLSTGALGRLRDDELEAVLRHESYHLHHRDPLRILVARLLAGTLFLFPLVSAHAQRFDVAKELDADQHALRAQGSAAALAGALQALSATASAFRSSDVAVGAWSAATHARVEQLCGDPEAALSRHVSRGVHLLMACILGLMLVLTGGQVARANLVPAAVIEGITGSAPGDIHQCPLPVEGILF